MKPKTEELKKEELIKLEKEFIIPQTENRKEIEKLDRRIKEIDLNLKQERQKAERFKEKLVFNYSGRMITYVDIQKLYEEIYNGNS